jgi:protein gp37
VAENTGISWAHNTFNPWWGCSRVSAACRSCYADEWDRRFGGDHWGANADRKTFGEKHWAKPLKWDRRAASTGTPERVFCASMGDVFEDHQQLNAPRQQLWDLIDQTPNLRWLILTKRPENVAGMVPWGNTWPRTVWLGVTAETQADADRRLPILASLPATVRFVSAAPLLGPLRLTQWFFGGVRWSTAGQMIAREPSPIHWVITEGESGRRAKPSHPDWFRDIRDRCLTHGVRYHHKQNGEWEPIGPLYEQPGDCGEADDARMNAVTLETEGRRIVQLERDGTIADGHQPADPRTWLMARVGVKRAGRLLDGRLWDEIADDPIVVTPC